MFFLLDILCVYFFMFYFIYNLYVYYLYVRFELLLYLYLYKYVCCRQIVDVFMFNGGVFYYGLFNFWFIFFDWYKYIIVL